MTQSFRCPSCSAPLKFQPALVQTCRFCGTDVLVPEAGSIAGPAQEKITETMPPAETEKLRDVSDLGQKALKIAEIKQALKGRRASSAAVLFRDSFGGSLADAREIIAAIEKGESISLPDFPADKTRGEKTVETADDRAENWTYERARKTTRKKWLLLLALILPAIVLLIILARNFFS